MNISFTKAHATGNDFVIIYNDELFDFNFSPKLIKYICNLKTGIGADGLLFLSTHNKCDFNIEYYNSDGSREALCANGMRCAALYMYKKTMIKSQSVAMCGDGSHNIVINANDISTSMCTPVYKTNEISILNYKGRHVNSGAPHFSIFVDDVTKIDVYNDGKYIRYEKKTFPNGINVNFYSINNNILSVRTYEKGVESEMNSCASGSVACAYDAYNKSLINDSPVKVRVLGGVLYIKYNSMWDNVWVTGPACLVYSGQFNSEVFNE